MLEVDVRDRPSYPIVVHCIPSPRILKTTFLWNSRAHGANTATGLMYRMCPEKRCLAPTTAGPQRAHFASFRMATHARKKCAHARIFCARLLCGMNDTGKLHVSRGISVGAIKNQNGTIGHFHTTSNCYVPKHEAFGRSFTFT